jgi:hypothetical protein
MINLSRIAAMFPGESVRRVGSKSLFRVGDNKIVSYTTIIGRKVDGIWYILESGIYSKTTSRHCNYMARELKEVVRIKNFGEIPKT